MGHLVKLVSKFSEIVATILTGALALTMLMQIVSRKVFNHSLSWTDEFGSFMLVWIALFGSVIVLYEGKHLAIDAISTRLKGNWAYLIRIIANLSTLIFVVSLLIYGIPMVQKTMEVYAISLHVSKGLIYTTLPLTALFMSIILMYDIIKDLKLLMSRDRKVVE